MNIGQVWGIIRELQVLRSGSQLTDAAAGVTMHIDARRNARAVGHSMSLRVEISATSVVHWDPILGSQLGIWDGIWDPNMGSHKWDGIFGPFRVHCSAIHTRNRKVVVHPILVS